MTEDSNRTIADRYFAALPAGFDELAELRHPEFIEEWPQSGERIIGHDAYRKIHENYPGGTPSVGGTRVTGGGTWVMTPSFTLLEVSGAGDTFVGEMQADYGGRPMTIVAILRLRDGKVHRQTTYFAEPFPAPEWRAHWVERI